MMLIKEEEESSESKSIYKDGNDVKPRSRSPSSFPEVNSKDDSLIRKAQNLLGATPTKEAKKELDPLSLRKTL
jgi:hypothetical protein